MPTTIKLFHPGEFRFAFIFFPLCALAWVIHNISRYGGNPDKIFVGGHSAGGTLALIVGLDLQFYDEVKVNENQIAGYISISAHSFVSATTCTWNGKITQIPEGIF